MKSTYYANGPTHPKPRNHNSLDPVPSCAVAGVCLEAQSPHFCTVQLRYRLSRPSFWARSDTAKRHPGVHRSSSRVLEQYQKTFEPPYSSRPASGFLLVSFSKVTRHLLRPFAPTFVAESLPNNANHYRRLNRKVGFQVAEHARPARIPLGSVKLGYIRQVLREWKRRRHLEEPPRRGVHDPSSIRLEKDGYFFEQTSGDVRDRRERQAG